MATEVRLGHRGAFIMRYLKDHPRSFVVPMVEASNNTLSRGTVYVFLVRLEARQFIQSEEETGMNRPGLPRRLYSLTEKGERVLEAWIKLQEAAA